MKLFVGLGNPGEKYKNNRHNVGFQVAEELVALLSTYLVKKNSGWENDSKLLAIVWKGENVIVVKPQTFMNSSGEAVKKLMDWYKISSDNLYVIHDDLDIKLGEYKIQKGKGPKIHNGILSIEEKIGTGFWRVRVGVDNRDPRNRIPGDQYVLQNFEKEEQEIIDRVVDEVINDIKI